MVSGGGKRAKDRGPANAGGSGASSYPSSRLLVWHSSFDHARSRHASLVRGHALAQQLEIVLPTRAAKDLAASLQWETSFFYEVTAPLTQLLTPRFISEYVANGALYMVAKNVAVDSQNTAMVLPSGELLVLVDNETYEQLGLVGHKYAQQIPADAQCAAPHRSSSGSRRGQRYVISIDLKSRAFSSPEPNAYRDRVVTCLATKFQPLTMLLASYNDRGAPRTILFDDDTTVERTRVEINGNHEQLHGIAVPALHQFFPEKTRPPHEKMDMAMLRGSLEGVYDWLGAVACRLTELLQRKPVEEYVSTFDAGLPDAMPMDPSGDLSIVTWRGLLGAEFTQRVLDRTRDAVLNGSIPWASVSVWGFADAVVSWRQAYESKQPTLSRAQQKKLQKLHETPMADVEKETVHVNREHGFLVNGNNNYTFLLLPHQEYFVLQELGPHDAAM